MQIRWQLLIKISSLCCGPVWGFWEDLLKLISSEMSSSGVVLCQLIVVLWNNKNSGSFSSQEQMLALQLRCMWGWKSEYRSGRTEP